MDIKFLQLRYKKENNGKIIVHKILIKIYYYFLKKLEGKYGL
jgi:hypothetical protein